MGWLGVITTLLAVSNPAIDMEGYLRAEPGTIVLDARSREKYDELHIREGPFPEKIATASLNLSTYIALYSYGYRNVYELGPLMDIESTKLEMLGAAPQGAKYVSIENGRSR